MAQCRTQVAGTYAAGAAERIALIIADRHWPSSRSFRSFVWMRILLLAPLILFAGHVCLAQGEPAPSLVKDVTPEELVVLLKTAPVTIYDCNEEDQYSFAHVPGAKLVVYDRITPEILPDDGGILVFYCYSPECPAAGMAAQTAADMGHARVYCMKAGITGWQDAGLPTEP